MATKRRDRLVGMTRFYDERTGRELVNAVKVDVTAKRAETVIGPAANLAHGKPVISDHPMVIGYQRDITALMRRTAYADRPITSLWVPKRARRSRDQGPAACPECNGTGETMIGEDEDARMVPCPACSGTGS